MGWGDLTNLIERLGVSNLLMLATLIVAAIVGVPTFLLWRKKHLEDRSAALTASLLRGATMPMGLHGQLVIRNNGRSGAREIDVSVNGHPIGKFLVPGTACIAKSDVIGPWAERSVLIIMDRKSLPPLDVKLTWSDDSGQPKTWRSTID